MVALALALFASGSSASSIEEATEASYAAESSVKGVVLLDVYWSRVWKCKQFQNAQLQSLVFEPAPLSPGDEASSAAWTLEIPSRLAPPKGFVSYAFLLNPGQYFMTGFEVGYARSISDVGAVKAARSDLVSAGKSKAGSFTVAAGESVYIGNFAVDCYKDPIPWRYYTEEKNFPKHEAQFRSKYPFLNASPMVFRLFETTTLGEVYEPK